MKPQSLQMRLQTVAQSLQGKSQEEEEPHCRRTLLCLTLAEYLRVPYLVSIATGRDANIPHQYV